MEKKIETKEVVTAIVVAFTPEEIETLKAILYLDSSDEEFCAARKIICELTSENVEMLHKGKGSKPIDMSKQTRWKVMVQCPRVESFKCLTETLVEFGIIDNTEVAKSALTRDVMGCCYNNNGELNMETWVTVACLDDYNKANELFKGLEKKTCLTAKLEEA